MTTTIEWTDETWNPVTGCTKVSSGCKNCYAETVANRFWGERKFTDVQTHPDRLDAPLRWRKPRRVFVNSMSDLFHGDVPDEFIDRVFAVMALAPQHTFQVLTKRPERMRKYFECMADRCVDLEEVEMVRDAMNRCAADDLPNASMAWHRETGRFDYGLSAIRAVGRGVALPNVWLGVSVEDQASADARIPVLLQTPAALRFLSCEPLLGAVNARFVDLHAVQHDGSCADWCDACGRRRRSGIAPDASIDWVIVGGESGPRARPCDVAWTRSIVEQCQAARVPCFVKQLGSCVQIADSPLREWPSARLISGPGGGMGRCIGLDDRKGGDPSEWPEDLRVREFPESA